MCCQWPLELWQRCGADGCKFAYLQVNVGKGTNTIHGQKAQIRDAVLRFLQHLMPVKLAAKNDGLVTVRRSDVQKIFNTIEQQQLKFDAAFFGNCFTARQ